MFVRNMFEEGNMQIVALCGEIRGVDISVIFSSQMDKPSRERVPRANQSTITILQRNNARTTHT